ncbi:MAG TPA: UPF0175 family protein [Phycisphaerales bacterium]|nr:UPF0175 family protein [Phycisphaerales bacterium]
MFLDIPDEILREAGLTKHDALVEFACRLFDAGKLDKAVAARLCGLERPAFEAELAKRGLTVYRSTLEDYELDRQSQLDRQTRKAG